MTCPFCGSPTPDGAPECPACGSPLDQPPVDTESGWVLLPPLKGRSRVDFDGTLCWIEGTVVPMTTLDLKQGHDARFSYHSLLWSDPGLDVGNASGGVADFAKRALGGMPLLLAEARGPGRMGLSSHRPGHVYPLPLAPGQSVHAREHVYLGDVGDSSYRLEDTNVYYLEQQGSDTETIRPLGYWWDRFQAGSGPALLLLHGKGEVFLRHLAHGQEVLCNPAALLFKDTSVQVQLHFEYPARAAQSVWAQTSGGLLSRMLEGAELAMETKTSIALPWLRLMGPGRVAIHSGCEVIEGNRKTIYHGSPATRRSW